MPLIGAVTRPVGHLSALPQFVNERIAASNPFAWWKLIDAAGTTTAAQSTGTSGLPSLSVTNIGSPTAASTLTFGNSGTVDSKNTYMAVSSESDSVGKALYGSTTGTPAVSDFTAGIWVRATSFSVSSFGAFSVKNFWHLTITQTGASVSGWNGISTVWEGPSYSSGSMLSWNHVVFTITGGGGAAYLYINGVQRGYTAASPTIAGTPSQVAIGATRANTFLTASQGLDCSHMAIWDRVLSGPEVAALYYP